MNSWTTRSWPVLLLAALAVLLVAPALLHGVPETDSARFNSVWALQFAEAVRGGTIYPRWMPGSWNGLGSPAFIFYPPFAFYIDAAIHLVTLGAVDVPHRLAATTAVLLFLSGLAMRAWLRWHVGPGTALLAACLYMASPYHMLDHVYRGALAEFSVYVALPLVAIGLRAAAASWRGLPLLAAGYALLTLSHLPSALLASLLMVPGYVLFLAVRAGTVRGAAIVAFRTAGGGALGLAWAAAYLLPALTLQAEIRADLLWLPHFTPVRWLLVNWETSPQPTLMLAIIAISLGLVILAAAATAARAVPEARLWALLALLCILLLSGIVPGVWTTVPLIAKVQFPWRILAVAEFAGITAFALAAPTLSRPMKAAALALALLAWSPAYLVLAHNTRSQLAETDAYWELMRATVLPMMPDAAEYLPRGFPDGVVMPGARPRPWSLPGPDTVTCTPAATRCTGVREGAEGVRVQVEATGPTTVTVTRFAWPGWFVAAGPGTGLRPADPYRLLAFDVPAGASTTTLRIGRTAAEWWGLVISALASLLLLALVTASRRARTR